MTMFRHSLLSSTPSEFVLVGDRVVTPDGTRAAAIHVRDGIIVAVGSPLEAPDSSIPRLEVGDRVILPGVVDTHVHVNEPGRTEWEGFETASRAAAAGGITTLVDMPLNSIPVTTTRAAMQTKAAAAAAHCWVDVGLWGGVVPGNAGELEPMIDAGILGFKCFLCPSGIDDFPQATEADLRVAMPILARRGVPLLVHAELCPADTPADDPQATSRHYSDYLASRPASWEVDAIALMIRLCRETGCPVHIVHLSAADALPLLAEARREGLPITVETCPHYLFFSAEQIPDGATHFKCAPPIRERENRERLWEGLRTGIIDFVVCDHSPCTPDLKRLEAGDFLGAWGGISSLQLSPSIVWSQAKARGFSIEDLVTWVCRRTARFAGLGGSKGAIAPGHDADLVVWDPDACFTLEPSMIHHRHRITPYLGETLYGVVEATFLRGKAIYERGVHGPAPTGKLLRRLL